MKRAGGLLILSLGLLVSPLRADMPPIKPAPTRPPEEPMVVVQEFDMLPDCAEDKVCGEGLIRNIGQKTAHNVRLRIDIAGTKYGKPRLSLYQNLDKDYLDPTEAQSVDFTVDRKVPYTNEKGESKVMEVGRYNVKMVPVWKEQQPPKAFKKFGTVTASKRK